MKFKSNSFFDKMRQLCIIILMCLLIVIVGNIKYVKELTMKVMNISDNNMAEDYSEKIPIYRVNGKGKSIAISFDVNWADKEHLLEILDVLDENKIKCTFFVMGKWINYPEENKEKLAEIYKRGHEIGNHSFSHADFKRVNEETMKKEVLDTEKAIDNICGRDRNKSMLFRFPSGSYNERAVKVVKNMGYSCIQWDTDSIDWKNMGLDKEYSKVIKGAKEGSIILFHNNGNYTAANLKKLIPDLKEKGYEFVTVGELIYKENSYLNSEGVQYQK